MRRRVLGVLTVLFLAPIAAELLSAYLGDLGGVGGAAFLAVYLAPLYGAPALVIREITLRTGRGWPGRFLLAAAFGVAMPTFIDGSLFTPVRDDIDGWGQIIGGATFAGIGWYAVVTWVFGHVLMSIAAPIAVAEGLARDQRPWLGRVGLAVTALLFVVWCVIIHRDQWSAAVVVMSAWDVVVSVAVVALLVVAAFTPLGRPLAPADRAVPSLVLTTALGFVAMAAFDLVPPATTGLVIDLVVLAASGLALAWWGRSPRWTLAHAAFLAYGALLARTVGGFLTPLAAGTTAGEKAAQSVAYALLLMLLGVALWRRTQVPVRNRRS